LLFIFIPLYYILNIQHSIIFIMHNLENSVLSVNMKIIRNLSALKKLNLPRIINLALLLFEIKFRRSLLKSRPLFYRIDTYPICNLSCPACLIGLEKRNIIPKRILNRKPMPLDTFKTIIDKIYKYAIKLYLYDEGEPLLCPDIFDMIAYAENKNIAVTISSNFCTNLSDNQLKQLI